MQPLKRINFLSATVEDIPVLLEMMAEFNAEAAYSFNKTMTAVNLQTFILEPQLGSLLTIRAGRTTIGYLVLAFGFSFEYGGRDAFIDELFVRKEYRKQGIGRLALEFAEQWAKELQVKAIHLEVERNNTAASGLYLKMEFTDNGRILLSRRVNNPARESGN